MRALLCLSGVRSLPLPLLGVSFPLDPSTLKIYTLYCNKGYMEVFIKWHVMFKTLLEELSLMKILPLFTHSHVSWSGIEVGLKATHAAS